MALALNSVGNGSSGSCLFFFKYYFLFVFFFSFSSFVLAQWGLGSRIRSSRNIPWKLCFLLSCNHTVSVSGTESFSLLIHFSTFTLIGRIVPMLSFTLHSPQSIRPDSGVVRHGPNNHPLVCTGNLTRQLGLLPTRPTTPLIHTHLLWVCAIFCDSGQANSITNLLLASSIKSTLYQLVFNILVNEAIRHNYVHHE